MNAQYREFQGNQPDASPDGAAKPVVIAAINKNYGSFQALHDVSLTIRPGEFITLLGPSGSGKTTLLKILAGFESVSSGTIGLDGRDITRLPPERRNFGFVFQGFALFSHLTVFENIAYPLRVRRMSGNDITVRVTEMLELVQLQDYARRKPSELSGGQQQRVALARALAFKPKLLLLDEPMSALDKKLRHALQEELREIHQRLGTTFVNVTHDQEEAMHMSDRIAVLSEGKIQQFDTASEIYRRPVNRFVAEFIGKSNIFSGVVRKTAQGMILSGDGFAIPLSAEYAEAEHIEIVARPEDLLVVSLGSQPVVTESILAGTVIKSTYSGDRVLYVLALPQGREILAYGSAQHGTLANGTQVEVHFNPQLFHRLEISGGPK
ncbi:ABC transporter ATP-binding protein (plasmid) [Brucella anthropi]|uniref:ABC transporter ATP-binding protein n=1 Tax=Brucella anthropi TaxID=529 RepID=UPI00188C0677|nr:ABC transporter ATP-binding protein [Brucella anthropi]QPA29863.1 ABC transporter ATP-binding protein [Brucella anthropi]